MREQNASVPPPRCSSRQRDISSSAWFASVCMTEKKVRQRCCIEWCESQSAFLSPKRVWHVFTYHRSNFLGSMHVLGPIERPSEPWIVSLSGNDLHRPPPPPHHPASRRRCAESWWKSLYIYNKYINNNNNIIIRRRITMMFNNNNNI